MNTRRLLMDARALLWPWCAVAAAALLASVSYRLFPGLSVRNVALLGFWFGVPLLATLVLGREFQYGTLAVLLSQPLDRRRIWFEKSTLSGPVGIAKSVYSRCW